MTDFVLTLPLGTEKWQEDILEKRLNIARQIYNACLGEVLSRYSAMQGQKEYGDAMNMEKGQERNAALSKLQKEFGITKFDLNRYVKPMGQKFRKNLGSQMVQEIAERAFSAFEKLMYGTAKKVKFKAYGELFSVREKGNATGLRYFEDENVIGWLGLAMPVMIKRNDEYAARCFQNKLKFCRLVKKVIRGINRYFVQMTFEGIPPQKHNREVSQDQNARVGLDIGVSTIAIASEKDVKLLELAESIKVDEHRKKLLQRKLDRQRRANNPGKYKEDGTIKKRQPGKVGEEQRLPEDEDGACRNPKDHHRKKKAVPSPAGQLHPFPWPGCKGGSHELQGSSKKGERNDSQCGDRKNQPQETFRENHCKPGTGHADNPDRQ